MYCQTWPPYQVLTRKLHTYSTMPTTTQSIAKDIPPRLHQPKSKAKSHTLYRWKKWIPSILRQTLRWCSPVMMNFQFRRRKWKWNIEVVVYCNRLNSSNTSHHMLLLLCSGAKMSRHKQVLLLGSGQDCHTAEKWSSRTILAMKRYIKDFSKGISCIKDSTKIICNFFAFSHGILDRQMPLGSISTGYFIEPLKVFWSFPCIFLFW